MRRTRARRRCRAPSRDERVDDGPPAQGRQARQARVHAAQPQVGPQRRAAQGHRVQVKRACHGMRRAARRHPDRHGGALRRGHGRELLVDAHRDRPQDAVDGNPAGMDYSPVPVRSALAPCGATPSGTAFASGDGAERRHIPPSKPFRKVSSF